MLSESGRVKLYAGFLSHIYESLVDYESAMRIVGRI